MAERTPEVKSSYAVYEFALATLLLFGVVSAVYLVFVPLAIGDVRIALAVVGVAVGVLVFGLIRSPWGRRSGAHLNPAITVALWLMGAFPGRRVVPYVVAQAAGSLTGTALAGLLWGTAVTGAPVHYAVVRPGPGWDALSVALTETGCLAVLTLVVGFFLAHPTHGAWLPLILGAATAVIIAVLGPRSGGSTNPIRQLGPAVLSGDVRYLAVYLLAPVLGAAAGAGIHRLLVLRTSLRRPRTFRLCPDTASQLP